MEDKKNNFKMEDKNIMINDTKYNFFQFYNINQPLTELKHFDTRRLIFTEPVARKLPNGIKFQRVFVAISGPQPRDVTTAIKRVYDVNELADYDSQFDSGEFAAKYDFSTLDDDDYHIIANVSAKDALGVTDPPVFLYNIDASLYEDEPAQRERVMPVFTYFDASKSLKQKPTLIKKLTSDNHRVLLTENWVKTNLSEKYVKGFKLPKPFVFPSEEVFSFGVSQNSLDTNGVSYQISLCLYDRETPKDNEIVWASKYEQVAGVCRDHLKALDKRLKGQADLMKGLSWKGNEIGDLDGPKLYPKVMYNQSKDEFITVFVDDTDELIEDPKLILDKRCKIKVALRFESIFIGSKLALQVRVNDAAIANWIEAYKPRSMILKKKPAVVRKPPKEESDSDSSQLNTDDSDEEEEEPKPVKRVVKTVKLN